MADKTQFEKLYDLLHNTDNGATYDQLQPERQELDGILANRDFSNHEDMSRAVTELARSVNGKVPYGFDEGTFAFNPEVYLQQEQLLQPQETLRQPEILTGSTKESHQKEPNTSGELLDTTTSALRSLQEQQLLEEFDKILASNDPEKIRRFLDTRLEAPDLLKDQWQIANQYIQQIKDPLIDKEHALRLLAEQHQQLLNKLQHAQPTDEDKKAKEKEQQLRDTVMKAENIADKRASYKELAQHRIAQMQPYSLFAIYENTQAGAAIVNAIANLLRTQAVMQENAARQEEVFAQDQEEASIQQAANQQRSIAQTQQGRAAQGASKKLAGKAIKKGAETAAKFFGPEAVAAEKIGWQLFKFFKDHKFITATVIALPVAFIFLPVIIIIILLATVFTSANATGQQTTGTGIHPVAPSVIPSDLVGDIRDKFGITMDGYDRTHLIWAWQKFYDISDTNFINLVRGKIVVFSIHAGSHVSCAAEKCSAFVAQYADQGTYDAILLHEIGHIIQWRQPSSVNHQTELPGIIAKEGYLTYYSRYNCLHVNQFYEDFAETLTYYLNPTVGQTTGCGHGPNPYANGANPLHYNFAQEVLGKY